MSKTKTKREELDVKIEIYKAARAEWHSHLELCSFCKASADNDEGADCAEGDELMSRMDAKALELY